jgi:TfoX/Sxy family transcriptional regulator of competence genes
VAPHVPAALKARLERAVGGSIELLFRPMFGGIIAYVGGKAFASLSDVGLAFKLGEADRAALLKLPGTAPLRYAEDQPLSKSYVTVSAEILADDAALAHWAHLSAAFAAAQPAAAPRKKKRVG